jgi:hypothetical protein
VALPARAVGDGASASQHARTPVCFLGVVAGIGTQPSLCSVLRHSICIIHFITLMNPRTTDNQHRLADTTRLDPVPTHCLSGKQAERTFQRLQFANSTHRSHARDLHTRSRTSHQFLNFQNAQSYACLLCERTCTVAHTMQPPSLCTPTTASKFSKYHDLFCLCSTRAE